MPSASGEGLGREGGSFEHLQVMPLEMLWCGQRSARARRQRDVGKFVDASTRWSAGTERARDLDAMVVGQAEHASIQQLVVQRTQSQSVVELVRAAEVEPSQVSGLKGDAAASQLPVEPAEGALAIPG